MMTALRHDGPVVFLESKLLSSPWLQFLGSGGRTTVQYDVPGAGAEGPVPDTWEPLPFGRAATRRPGSDLLIASLGVGVHRSLRAAELLQEDGISTAVLDLRTVRPLDAGALCEAVRATGRLLVVDEDYEAFGLSGELAATALEAGLEFSFARVCTRDTIPYARPLEDRTLPNAERIRDAAHRLLDQRSST